MTLTVLLDCPIKAEIWEFCYSYYKGEIRRGVSDLFTFFVKRGFKWRQIFQTFLYLQENQEDFLKVQLFFINDAKKS